MQDFTSANVFLEHLIVIFDRPLRVLKYFIKFRGLRLTVIQNMAENFSDP